MSVPHWLILWKIMGLFESSISLGLGGLRGGLLRFIGSECPTLVNFVEDHGAIRDLHKPGEASSVLCSRGGLLRFIGSECPTLLRFIGSECLTLVNLVEDHGFISEEY